MKKAQGSLMVLQFCLSGFFKRLKVLRTTTIEKAAYKQSTSNMRIGPTFSWLIGSIMLCVASSSSAVTVEACTDLTDPECLIQTIEDKNETRFCEAYRYNRSTGVYEFSTVFGLTQEIQPDNYLTELIESRCGTPVR